MVIPTVERRASYRCVHFRWTSRDQGDRSCVYGQIKSIRRASRTPDTEVSFAEQSILQTLLVVLSRAEPNIDGDKSTGHLEYPSHSRIRHYQFTCIPNDHAIVASELTHDHIPYVARSLFRPSSRCLHCPYPHGSQNGIAERKLNFAYS